MPSENVSPPSDDVIEIDLRSQGLAAVLAWLWPGAGHMYQGRYGKAILFMVCILGTYFFGLALGDGRVVYASWKKNDYRWQYACQIWVGMPALPALVQTYMVNNQRPPLFEGRVMAPPDDVTPGYADELARWHKSLGAAFELGTLYTVIAGLLNVLAIYDAYGGPFVTSPDRASRDKLADKRRKQQQPSTA